MKRFCIVAILLCPLCFLTCQEPKEDLNDLHSRKEFYRTIGEEIPFETGMQWIEYYQKMRSNGGARTETPSSYVVSAAQMDVVLTSTTDLVGVAFHYALDDAAETHILVIPVDGTLDPWSSIPGRVFVDANTGEQISQSTASLWADNYRNAHPSDVWYHFFGKYIFDDMKTLQYFSSVDIEPAINTVDLTPEMLLIVWNEETNLLGRTTSSGGTVYDASNACPPCEP